MPFYKYFRRLFGVVSPAQPRQTLRPMWNSKSNPRPDCDHIHDPAVSDGWLPSVYNTDLVCSDCGYVRTIEARFVLADRRFKSTPKGPLSKLTRPETMWKRVKGYVWFSRILKGHKFFLDRYYHH